MVTLTLASKNDLECLKHLKISKEQERFMFKSNEDYFNTFDYNFLHFCVRFESNPIGLIVAVKDILDHEDFASKEFYKKECYFLTHLMIDVDFQGNGFGEAAIMKLESEFNRDVGYSVLFHHIENIAARNLYLKCGYETCGITMDESEMVIKRLKNR